jgi:(1->4)-alpha-D-glucan 1-alpha-D-glucosylmutase
MHRYLTTRQASWPRALSALSTHDTKRSEDVRARLNVLSEIPGEWRERVRRWGGMNERHRRQVDDLTAPDRNEEYLLYQTLLGAWPLEPYTAEEYAAFVSRVQAYMVKALHEAKVHSSWINPDAAYDGAVQEFVADLLDEGKSPEFLRDLAEFRRFVSHLGLLNALGQTLVRCAAPGVPDTYQGTEVWDFSLVDPDNRRPVDYDRRRRLLADLGERLSSGADRRGLARELAGALPDGRAKLHVISRLLHQRRENPGLFTEGDYLPVPTEGGKADHAFAFLRRRGDAWALVAVPRLLTRLVRGEGGLPVGGEVWGDTRLVLPEAARGVRFENVFTGEALAAGDRPTLRAADVFATFPVALALSVRG